MSGTVCAVLKSGGIFEPRHAKFLKDQINEKMPDWDFRLWTDFEIPGTLPLKYKHPKWWGKYEIYRTPFEGPALVVDLDTVFVARWNPVSSDWNRAHLARDPYAAIALNKQGALGGFVYLPEWARAKLADRFWKNPEQEMLANQNNDQPILRDVLWDDAVIIQDRYIDELVSYKIHVRPLGLRPENRVVYFHGQPRPWDLDLPWIPSLEK